MHHLDPDRLRAQGRALRRLAVVLVGPDAAADVVQDAYVVAMQRGTDAEGRPPGRGWLRGIVRNRAREHHRATGRRSRREDHARPTAPPDEPGEHAAAMEAQHKITEALHALPEPYRTTLWLRYFAGKRTTTIAREMHVPAATVRTRLKRGLERLRAALDAEHDGERGRWRAALAPLLPAAHGAALQSLATGAAWKLAVPISVAAVVAGLAFTAWSLLQDQAPTVPERGAPVRGKADVGAPTLVVASDATQDKRAAHGVPAGDVAETAPGAAPADAAARHQVRGQVLRDDGRPVRDATVYAIPKARPPWGLREPNPPHVEVDASGRFTLPLDDLDRWLVAAPNMNAGLLRRYVDLTTHARGTPVVFRLEQAPLRTVRVVDEDGVPFVGASVGVVPDLDLSQISSWSRPGDASMGGWMGPTDDRGRYAKRFPWHGPLRVTAGAQGHHAPPRRWEAEDDTTEVVLARSAVLRVTVVGLTPPQVASVRLTTPQHEMYRYGAKLDMATGVHVFDSGLGKGDYALQVQAKGFHDKTVPIHIPAAGADVPIRVELEARRDLAKVALRHTRLANLKRPPEGEVTPECVVFYRRGDEPWRYHWATHSGADGVIPLPELGAGAWSFVIRHAQGDAYGRADVQIDAGGTREVHPHYRTGGYFTMPVVPEAIGRRVRDAEVEAGGLRFPLGEAGNGRTFAAAHVPATFTALFETRIGPYPGETATLWMTLDDGSKKTIPLRRADK